MNIAIGKVGKAVNFKQREGYKLNVGTDSAVIFMSLLARMNPDYNFYLIGPNDLPKLNAKEYETYFPDKNMFSVFEYHKEADEPYKFICDNLDNMGVKIDFGIFLLGVVTMMSIPKFLKKDMTAHTVICCSLLKSMAGLMLTFSTVQTYPGILFLRMQDI